jgi:hypothetical protein
LLLSATDRAGIYTLTEEVGDTLFVTTEAKHLFWSFFFRNGVSPASASIDAHGRFIENGETNVVSVFYIASSTGTSRLMTSHYLRMPRKSAI